MGPGEDANATWFERAYWLASAILIFLQQRHAPRRECGLLYLEERFRARKAAIQIALCFCCPVSWRFHLPIALASFPSARMRPRRSRSCCCSVAMVRFQAWAWALRPSERERSIFRPQLLSWAAPRCAFIHASDFSARKIR